MAHSQTQRHKEAIEAMCTAAVAAVAEVTLLTAMVRIEKWNGGWFGNVWLHQPSQRGVVYRCLVGFVHFEDVHPVLFAGRDVGNDVDYYAKTVRVDVPGLIALIDERTPQFMKSPTDLLL